jgi:hypothetical protein
MNAQAYRILDILTVAYFLIVGVTFAILAAVSLGLLAGSAYAQFVGLANQSLTMFIPAWIVSLFLTIGFISFVIAAYLNLSVVAVMYNNRNKFFENSAKGTVISLMVASILSGNIFSTLPALYASGRLFKIIK